MKLTLRKMNIATLRYLLVLSLIASHTFLSVALATVSGVNELPVIGVSKETTAVTVVDANTVTAVFTIYLENLGNVDLNQIQVNEDLSLTFPAPAQVSVIAASATNLSVNPGFNGLSDIQLLSGNDVLLLGQLFTVQLSVEVQLNGASGPFTNSVLATAQSPLGTMVSDVSNSGPDPDPNGDGNPGSAGEDAPTPITLPPLPPPTALAVPTLHFTLLFWLAIALFALGGVVLRRRGRS